MEAIRVLLLLVVFAVGFSGCATYRWRIGQNLGKTISKDF